MVGAADEQQSAKAAYRAGEDHGADDDLVHLDTDVARGAFTLADNGDLVAVLGVIQIEIHQNRDNSDDENIQKIFVAADLREPADLRGLVDDADLAGALGVFPDDDEIGHKLRCNVVHHQREKRFIRIVFCLEIRRNEAPERTGQDAAHAHAHDNKGVRQRVAQADHARRRCERTGKHLTFTADVPEAHLKSRRHGERDAEKHRDVLQQPPDLAGRAE